MVFESTEGLVIGTIVDFSNSAHSGLMCSLVLIKKGNQFFRHKGKLIGFFDSYQLHTNPIMTDIEYVLDKLVVDKRELKTKITGGKERYARLKGLLRRYKAELTMEWLDSPVVVVELEEQIENMKELIRIQRELINADVMRWMTLKEEENRLKGFS